MTSSFQFGTPSDPDQRRDLLDAVRPPPDASGPQTRSAMLVVLPWFTVEEAEKLKAGQTALSGGGGRHRRLDKWLVPANHPDVELHVSTAGLTVQIPNRDFPQPTRPVPESGEIEATIVLTDSTGALELPAETELDVDLGWLRASAPFPGPAERLRAVDALHAGRAEVRVRARGEVKLAGGDGEPVPLVIETPPPERRRPPRERRPPPRERVPPRERARRELRPPRPLGGPARLGFAATLSPAVMSALLANGPRLTRAPRRFELRPDLARLAHFQPLLGHLTKLAVPAGGQKAVLLMASGPGTARATASWSGGGTMTLRLKAPSGWWMATAEGTSPLVVSARLDAGVLAGGSSGFRVEVQNPGAAREVSLNHSLPRAVQRFRRGEQPPQLPVLRVMPDNHTSVTIQAGGTWTRDFSGEGRLVEAWIDQSEADVLVTIANDDGGIVGTAQGRAASVMGPEPRSDEVPYRLTIVNKGEVATTLRLRHTPGQLRQPELPDDPAGPAAIAQAEIDVDSAWALQAEIWLDDGVYEFLQADLEWQFAAVPGASTTLWFRASSELVGAYHVLPSSFRLGFRALDTLPAVIPELVLRDGAADPPAADDYRIRVLLAAVPWTDPRDREALRRYLQDTRKLPFVDLLPPPSLQATFEDPFGDQGDGTPVDLDGGFVLQVDMPARDYAIFAERLAASVGVEGQIVVERPEPPHIALPVRLSLEGLAPAPVRMEFGRTVNRVNLFFENLCAEDVQIDSAQAWVVHHGEIAIHGADPVSVDAAITLAAGEKRSIPLGDHSIQPGESMRVLLGPVGLPGVTASDWLDRVNRERADVAPVSLTVRVPGTGVPGLAEAGYQGMQITLRRPGVASAPEAFVVPGEDTWTVSVPNDLAAWAGGDAGLAGLEVEARARYAGRLGLPQRVPVTSSQPWVALPGVELPDSSYRIERVAHDGDPGELEGPLGLAAADARLAELASQGATWRLTVAPPAVVDPVPDPVDDPVPDPVDDPVPDPVDDPGHTDPTPAPDTRQPVEIVTQLLGLGATVSQLFLTLTPDGGPVDTLRIEGATDSVVSWLPPSGEPVPLAWDATYVLTAGGVSRASGRLESEHVLVLSLPPD